MSFSKNFGTRDLLLLVAVSALCTASQAEAKQEGALLKTLSAPPGYEKSAINTTSADRRSAPAERLCLKSDQKIDSVNSVKMNGTQLKYWIELDRDGQKLHVTNQETFRTGDKIKFHVQASTDGFLYIVLRTGSRGEQEILFPHPKLKDNNRIVKNVDYVLPEGDYLLFDEFPGTEKLVLMFSRQPIELKQALATKNRIVLRGAAGSKDLVPADATVSYTDSNGTPQPETSPNSSSPAKPADAKASQIKAAIGKANGDALPEKTPIKETTTPASTQSPTAPIAPATNDKTQTQGDVVFQHNDPDQVLAVDIDLVHK